MKTVVIIDDEPLARSIVLEYLQSREDLKVVAECDNGYEGVKAILFHKPDLVFLDIQMPKINGFEMLELVDAPPPVIFVTAFDQYAIRAFEANAVDYLLKPFSEERFAKAITRYLQQSIATQATQEVLNTMALTPEQSNRIVVKTGSRIAIIQHHDIQYLEADDDYVRIVTPTGSFLKNKTMSFYEQTLDPKQFVRVHRSYMVHVGQVTRIDPFQKESYLAVLRDGKQIPVSKTGYLKLKEILGL